MSSPEHVITEVRDRIRDLERTAKILTEEEKRELMNLKERLASLTTLNG